MSRPNSTLRERKQRATRQRLLGVALALFAERGYEGTTMDDIAVGADVSRATAFNYFPRKEEFLLAWVEQRRSTMADLLAREQSASVNTLDRIRHAFASLADALEANADTNRALIRAWVQAGGPLLPNAFATAALFADTLRDGRTRGEIRQDANVDRAGHLLLDAYLGVLTRWCLDNGLEVNLREELDTVLDLAINGLRPIMRPRR